MHQPILNTAKYFDGKVVDFFPFLIAREAIFFTLDFSTYLLASIARTYCNKIVKLCSIPLKQLVVASPHNYEVRVLLYELYPEQGQLLGGNAFHRTDLNVVDDYMLALQKISDDIGDPQMDEINFLFQTNHLPISVFQPTPKSEREIEQPYNCVAGCSSAAGTSSSSSRYQNVTNSHLVVKPESTIDLSEAQTCMEGAKIEVEDQSGCDRMVVAATENNDRLVPQFIRYESQRTRIPSGSVTSSIADGSSSCGYQSCYSPQDVGSTTSDSLPIDANYIKQNLIKAFGSYSAKQCGTESSSSSCGEEPSFLQNFNVVPPNPRVSVFSGPLTAKSFMDEKPITSKRSLSDNQQTWKPVLKSLSNQMGSQTIQPNKLPNSTWPLFEKVHGQRITDTFLKSFNYNDTDDEDDEDEDSVSDEHSSDSECYRRSSLRPFHRHDRCLKLEPTAHSMRALSCGASSRSHFCDCSDCSGGLDGCFLADLSDSERGDRHIRDVNILDRLKVPYSYDEIAYSTNERFREIKSTLGLSIDQITAMLDARRRATNRQAAERCRRVKSTARNNLAARLDQLRLERATLYKRLIRTRKKRQQARDELTSAQENLIKILIGPDGNSLDPSQWRLQTTTQGELVVVQSASKS